MPKAPPSARDMTRPRPSELVGGVASCVTEPAAMSRPMRVSRWFWSVLMRLLRLTFAVCWAS